jgi:hypothetical protein
MSKQAITSIWDWSTHYLAAMFLLHQHYEDDPIIAVWMDNSNPRRVFVYDEFEDDGFVEYYVDGVAQVTWAKENTHRYLQN